METCVWDDTFDSPIYSVIQPDSLIFHNDSRFACNSPLTLCPLWLSLFFPEEKRWKRRTDSAGETF